MKLNIFKRDRHARWLRDLDAYVDGELARDEIAAFERHSAGCELCAEAVEQARFAKTLLISLPQLQAPRSFAITEAMVSSRPPLKQTAPGPVYRLAQATAFAALAGFATLVAVDLTSGGSGDAATSAAPVAELADSAPGDDGGAPSAAGLTQSQPTEVPVAGQATPEGSVAAAGGTNGYDAGTGDDEAPRTAEITEKQAAGDGPGEPPSLALATENTEDDGSGGIRVVQAALAVLAIAMGATWFVLRRRQRSVWS